MKNRSKRGCGKRRFSDRVAAELALATITRKDNTSRGHREQRAYRCPSCRAYHLTHLKEWGAE